MSTMTRSCHHCGRSSSSLLRCSQCKSAYYCNRTCQAAAWDPKQSREDECGSAPSGGHRSVCRRLRKRVDEMTAASSRHVDESAMAKEAWRDLARHVQSMDRNEAYKQMCMAQDEIQRLQQSPSYAEINHAEAGPELLYDTTRASRGSRISAVDAQEGRGSAVANTICSEEVSTATDPDSPTQRSQDRYEKSKNFKESHLVVGSWIDNGGACSIEYLPNVKSYLLTLLSSGESEQFCCIPKSTDDLIFEFSVVENNPTKKSTDFCSSSISYYKAELFHILPTENHDNCDSLLLSLVLPADRANDGIQEINPKYNISTHKNSVSIRIQFNDLASTNRASIDNNDVVNELLGVDVSTLSTSTITEVEALNHLCCRSCNNPIVANGVIRSVLPLPSGYWDDITDYLICYEGQTNVEFSSSSTSAIRGKALEDDAILIMHKQDLLTEEGGICQLNVKGYGEYSSNNNEDDEIFYSEMNSQPWKDKSSKTGAEVQAITCAICCSTLGFVSNHYKNTYRFYKHLLSCRAPSDSSESYCHFAKHTCSSFLAREMIRYAESEAIYTFIVATDNYSTSSRSILLRMLSWDSIMATFGCSDNKENCKHKSPFQKVLKVIFEETSNQFNTATNSPMDWNWGGIDMCCPPLANKNSGSTVQAEDSTETNMKISNISGQTKATSVRICLTPREWYEFKDSLTTNSQYFSEAVHGAVVMAKLGMLREKITEHSAILSFLPVLT